MLTGILLLSVCLCIVIFIRMDAPNVAAHIHMSARGAAGGELRQLIVNKVMMHGIWHLIKESFELAGKSLQRTSGF